MHIPFVVIFLINCGQVFNYGTIVTPPLVNPLQDCQTITISPQEDTTLIQIFPHRTFYERQQINATCTQLTNIPFTPGEYVTLTGNKSFQDCLYAMIAGPMKTFTAYMYSSLNVIQDSSYGPVLIEILVVADNGKQSLIYAYDQNPNYGGSFANAVAQRTQGDYRNFLQELIQRIREPESTPIDPRDVNIAVQGLLIESQNWNNHRDLIDYILMNKSKKFAQQVIQQFPAANSGRPLVQTVYENISDSNLKFGYASLVYFILDPVDWIAARIHDAQSEFDQKATKILFIVPYSECCLYEINLAFKIKYQMTIGQYLRANNPQDPTDLMLASVADDGIAGSI